MAEWGVLGGAGAGAGMEWTKIADKSGSVSVNNSSESAITIVADPSILEQYDVLAVRFSGTLTNNRSDSQLQVFSCVGGALLAEWMLVEASSSTSFSHNYWMQKSARFTSGYYFLVPSATGHIEKIPSTVGLKSSSPSTYGSTTYTVKVYGGKFILPD